MTNDNGDDGDSDEEPEGYTMVENSADPDESDEDEE